MGVVWFTNVVTFKESKRRFLLFLVISLIFNWLGEIVFTYNFSCKFLVFACTCRSLCSRMTYPGLWNASVALYWGIKDSLNDFIWCVMFLISSNWSLFLKKSNVLINFAPFAHFWSICCQVELRKSPIFCSKKVPVNFLSSNFIWCHFDLVISGFQKVDKEFWS